MIPPDDVHPQLWVGANKKFRKVPRARVEKMKQERVSIFIVTKREDLVADTDLRQATDTGGDREG